MTRRVGLLAGVGLAVLCGALAAWWGVRGRESRSIGPPVQEAYVWQRDWSEEVIGAVAERGPRLNRLVVLVAELRWRSAVVDTTRITIPWSVLASIGKPVGLAIRVGTYPGPFAVHDPVAERLRVLVREILRTAQSHQVTIAELQLDFDCADRSLDGYRVWVEMLRQEVRPVPLVITALPSWLSRDSFGALVQATDGYVLQVHSLERPRGPDDATAVLCDPKRARQAVERAARFGVPFRVALPTYGYRLVFDAQGRFAGASAEGPPTTSPPGGVQRVLSADPVAMSDLVAQWTADRPALMTGILWYRMPVEGDRWNWRWSTLEAVMAGHAPKDSVTASLIAREPGLLDLQIANEGTGDRIGPLGIHVVSRPASVVGSDAVRGFRAVASGDGDLLFTNASCRLRSGDRAIIGWMRIEASSSIESLRLEVIAGP